MRTIPTAPVAAASLIGGYAVAAASGSRPLGGLLLAAGGVWCAREWSRRYDIATSVQLSTIGLAAFVSSHVLGPRIGAWPAVLVVSGVTAAAAWLLADSRSASAAPLT